MGDTGLEQPPNSSGKAKIDGLNAAESGASECQNGADDGSPGSSKTDRSRPVIDPELARIVEVWPDLPEHIRAAVMALVTSAGPKAGQ